MKKLVAVTKVEGEGLTKLLGENVLLFCLNYIYTGKLVSVNKDDVLLENAQIVYETGALVGSTFQDAQALPFEWYVKTACIESFGKSGR